MSNTAASAVAAKKMKDHLPEAFREKPFKAKEFVEQVAAMVSARQWTAPRAYALAAQRMRYEAGKPENSCDRLQLQMLANKFDELSAKAPVPPIEYPEASGEEIRGFVDTAMPGIVTEYDALVNDVAMSKIDPATGEPVGDLASAWQLQKKIQQRDDSESPPVRVTPISAIPGVTMFSNQALCQFGGKSPSGSAGLFAAGSPILLQEAQVCRWDGREQEAQMVTVSAARILNASGATFPTAGPAATPNSYRPFVHLFWGTSLAQSNEAFVDLGRGIQFRLACSFLYVNVGMDAPPAAAGGVSPVPGSMMLAGSFGFYGAGGSFPVQRTVYVDNFANAGATQTIVVPRFATSLLPVQTSDSIPNLTMNFQSAGGTTRGQLKLQTQGQMVSPIPLGSEIYQIALTNNGTDATANFDFVFQLAL